MSESYYPRTPDDAVLAALAECQCGRCEKCERRTGREIADLRAQLADVTGRLDWASKELDRAKAELEAKRITAGVLNRDLLAAEARWGDAIAEAEKGARFKSYVHSRLDEAGIPTHPAGPHSAEGCRVGDRLDLLIGERDALREALPDARILELADRLDAPGPKAAGVSASELDEVVMWIKSLAALHPSDSGEPECTDNGEQCDGCEHCESPDSEKPAEMTLPCNHCGQDRPLKALVFDKEGEPIPTGSPTAPFVRGVRCESPCAPNPAPDMEPTTVERLVPLLEQAGMRVVITPKPAPDREPTGGDR